jgi:sterol-4alpha-carboxylate 3-dehydrogenase (decarboxylating)
MPGLDFRAPFPLWCRGPLRQGTIHLFQRLSRSSDLYLCCSLCVSPFAVLCLLMAIPSALITGGTGFVGSAIIEALAKTHPECSITSLDINPPKFIPASKQSVAFVQADVTNLDDVTRAIADASPALVIHTAGLVPSLAERYGRQSKNLVQKINVEGTRNVMKAAQDAGVQAFVYTSSCCSVTDDFSFPYAYIDERWPTSRASLIYGESKVM